MKGQLWVLYHWNTQYLGCTKMPKQRRLQGSCSWMCTAVSDKNLYHQNKTYDTSAERAAARICSLEAHPCGKMFHWKILLVLSVLIRKRFELHSPYRYRKNNAPPTKSTNATVFLHSLKVYCKPCLQSQSLIFLEIPAFVWFIHHFLFMAQCFPYWLLNVVLYCLPDNPDETAMFNLNYSSPILGGILCML